MGKINKKEVRHPENLDYKGKLIYGDVVKLAKTTKRNPQAVRDIFDGKRAMPDDLLEATLNLLKRRQQMKQELNAL